VTLLFMSTTTREGSSPIRRRRIEFNKPMKLTVACGARSLSQALDPPEIGRNQMRRDISSWSPYNLSREVLR
jgi:hypothetical protein